MDSLERPYAFIDGSFNEEKKIVGWGGFLVDDNGVRHDICGHTTHKDFVSMRNVGGEILAAKEAIGLALRLGLTVLNLYYDYEGIERWPMGQWKTKKMQTRMYVNYIAEALAKGLMIHFHHVNAHTGVEGNEIADQMAKREAGIEV